MANQTDLNLWDLHVILPELTGEESRDLDHPNLVQLSARVLGAAQNLRGRAQPDFFRRTVYYTILRRFRDQGRDLDEKQMARCMASAVRFHHRKLTDWCHQFPVHLESLPSDRQIILGPVTFSPLSAFAAKADDPAAFRDWIGQADMVAEVSVPGCDEPMSLDRARQAMDRARDILRFLVALDRHGDAALQVKLGEVLGAVTDPARPWPLADRLLDAISWFGIAEREGSMAASITLYVNALERLTMTQDHMSITDSVARRSAYLMTCSDKDQNLESCRKQTDSLYQVRCDLVHGGISPFDPDLPEQGRLARKTTTDALLGAVHFFDQLGFDHMPFTAKAMEKAYDEMEKRQES